MIQAPDRYQINIFNELMILENYMTWKCHNSPFSRCPDNYGRAKPWDQAGLGTTILWQIAQWQSYDLISFLWYKTPINFTLSTSLTGLTSDELLAESIAILFILQCVYKYRYKAWWNTKEMLIISHHINRQNEVEIFLS